MADTDDPFGSEAPPPAWRVLDEEHLQHCKVFDLHRATMESPRTGDAHPFYRIESPDWVNIVALTRDEHLVLVRQFRHGSRTVTLEIPGGLIDPGRLEDLGSLNPNPALFGNRVHMQLALECERVDVIRNESTEHTTFELLPVTNLRDVVRRIGIDHALAVSALYAYEIWRDGHR